MHSHVSGVSGSRCLVHSAWYAAAVSSYLVSSYLMCVSLSVVRSRIVRRPPHRERPNRRLDLCRGCCSFGGSEGATPPIRRSARLGAAETAVAQFCPHFRLRNKAPKRWVN